MIKKTITFENFEGEKETKDYYFSLSQAELMELNLSTDGGLENKGYAMLASKNPVEVYNLVKMMILKACGIKIGSSFVKKIDGVPVADMLECTDAFTSLINELLSGDGSKFIEFMTGCLPKNMATAYNQQKSEVLKKVKEEHPEIAEQLPANM